MTWTPRRPNCGYSLRIVLKQCGQVATIVEIPCSACAADSVATFSLGEHLEEVLVAGAACRVARAGLLSIRGPRTAHRPGAGAAPSLARPCDCDRRRRRRSRSRRAHRRRARSPVGAESKIVRHGAVPSSRARAPIGLAQHRDLEALRPVEARRLRLAPRVAGVLHVAEGGVELLREAALLEHRVAADLDDRVDVLDEHRAALDAPAAGGALPDRLLREWRCR